MKVSGRRRSAAKVTVASLTIAATVALSGAPVARATDGGEHAYLPRASDWCLGASQPKIESVGATFAFVEFEYRDECTFLAWSSVEIRSESGGGWRNVGLERTKPIESDDKGKWLKRRVGLSELRDGTRYFVRTRIDYLFSDAHTNELEFRTARRPRRRHGAELPAGL